MFVLSVRKLASNKEPKLNINRRLKMHLPMKGKRYADVEAIQKACPGILTVISANELKHSFDMLLDRAKCCIEAQGDYLLIYKNESQNVLLSANLESH